MKKIFRVILVAIAGMIAWAGIVFFATINGWLHKPIASNKMLTAFHTAADSEIRKQFTGNFAMATIANGEVEAERFFSSGKEVDRNTVFQVSSLSKWITAFGIMKLVQDGKLDLDAPVSRYLTRWQLPRGQFDNEDVTVRRLLSHTAGLTDGLGYSGFAPGETVQSVEGSLTKASDADEGTNGSVQVGIQPGAEFKYSGGGYTLLQLIVEEVTGTSFESYMKAAVFEPLKMKHSTYIWNDSSGHTLAEFYHSDGTKANHFRYTSLAATSLYTSLSDMEIFVQAFLNGKNNEPMGRNILTPENLKLMRKSHARQMGVDTWGLGTMLYAETDHGDFIIGHDGKSTPAINTAVRLNPETGDGIIVLETGNASVATRLASEWVFWRTGKVDTLLFISLAKGMMMTIFVGWIVIVGIAIVGCFKNW